MGVTKEDLAKDLIPDLNTLVRVHAKYEMITTWLTINHPHVMQQYSRWLHIQGPPRVYGIGIIREWLEDNHPELIPMIDLLEAAQCE